MTGETTGAAGEPSRSVLGWTWPNYIGWGAMINQARMEADWKGLWDYAIPHLHATEETVASTEAQLGFRLPESYRNFLLASNGWPCFYLDMTAFSTSDLLGGELHKAGQTQLELEECVEAMAADGVIAADHFPVAASLVQTDVALMGKPGACPVFCVSVLQVGVDSIGVGGVELGQGLVPVGGDLIPGPPRRLQRHPFQIPGRPPGRSWCRMAAPPRAHRLVGLRR